MKKATKPEWEQLQQAIKSGNIEDIKIAGVKWNQSLLKYHQQH